MKILITGGSGFIGRNLVDRLSERHEVDAPGRATLDLLDAEAVRAYLEARRFDAVVHAASEGVSRMRPAGPEMPIRNCRMFFHLARNAHAFGRMLFLGSGAVYDKAHWQPRMTEEYFDAHVPADDYGFSKYVCARAADAMERVYELRLFGVFGRHEDWQARFVSNACCRAMHGLPIVIRRNAVFDYLDAEDVAAVVECCLAKDLRHRHYNVCRGEAIDLRTIAEKIACIAGRVVEISVRDETPVSEYSGDNSRLLAEFPGLRFRAIHESVKRLYAWIEARKDQIDPGLLRFDG